MKDGQKIFYLLGGVAASIFDEKKEEESNEKIANLIKGKSDYATIFYEHGITHPTELMNEYDGWNAFSEIPEELYKLLQNEK